MLDRGGRTRPIWHIGPKQEGSEQEGSKRGRMQGSTAMLPSPVTIRAIRRRTTRWPTHPTLAIIASLLIFCIVFIYNSHLLDGNASSRESKSLNLEIEEKDKILLDRHSEQRDEITESNPKTGVPSSIPATENTIDTGTSQKKRAQSGPKTTKKAISDVIEAFTLQHQLPNYFLHGRQGGLTGRYRSGNVVYAHNVKTGGTTLKTCIREYGLDHHVPTVLIHSLNRVEMLKKYEIEGGPQNKTLFIGDGTFTVCEYLTNKPCSYFTMFREPIARIVSEYLFCQQPDAGCSLPSLNTTVQAWAMHGGSRQFNNLLWRYQSNGHFPLVGKRTNFQHRPAAFRSMAARLQRAYPDIVTGNQLCFRMTSLERQAFLKHCLKNLENWFAVIGLTEEFDKSIDLYHEVYQLPFREYYHGAENVGQIKTSMDKAAIEQLKNEIRSDPLIMDALYEDFKIYEKAQEIMEKQKKVFHKMKET